MLRESFAPLGQVLALVGTILLGLLLSLDFLVVRSLRIAWNVLRWPATRILRVGGLGVAAGLAAGGAWKGTTPLVVVAGAALFVAALDALEPLAQEMDHPTRRDSFPILPGRLATASLAVPAAVLALTTAVGVGRAATVMAVPLPAAATERAEAARLRRLRFPVPRRRTRPPAQARATSTNLYVSRGTSRLPRAVPAPDA